MSDEKQTINDQPNRHTGNHPLFTKYDLINGVFIRKDIEERAKALQLKQATEQRIAELEARIEQLEKQQKKGKA